MTTSCTRKHALVTGASTGIGRATAFELAGRGWHVFATVRRPADGAALQHTATGQLTPLVMDVTQSDQITAATELLQAHVDQRGLDALINNAGVGLAFPLELVPIELFRTQFAINVDAMTRSRIKISSKLLILAKIVRDTESR